MHTLAHEIAHCKERIAKLRKGIEYEPTGEGWKIEEGRAIPVAPWEKRAERYKARVKKRGEKREGGFLEWLFG